MLKNIAVYLSLIISLNSCARNMEHVIIIDSYNNSQIFFSSYSKKGGAFFVDRNGKRDLEIIRKNFKSLCDYYVYPALVQIDRKKYNGRKLFNRVDILGKISISDKIFFEKYIKPTLGEDRSFCISK